jgi:death on curing protein
VSKPTWKWVNENVVLAIHDQQLAEHGGLSGTRDHALVLSALARPLHLATFDDPDVAELAAAYAYGISRNHGFLDGNKRTAFVVAYVFLLDNGYDLIATDQEATTTMVSVAEGQMTEAELAVWFRAYVHGLPPLPEHP